MDWLLDVFATWLYGLKVIAITLAGNDSNL
ncbi:hypothetical protein, partial [Escherichia coli]